MNECENCGRAIDDGEEFCCDECMYEFVPELPESESVKP